MCFLTQYIKTIFIFLVFTTLSSTASFANEETSKFDKFWEKLKSEGSELLDTTLEFTSEFIVEVETSIDANITKFVEAQDEETEVDIQDKLDRLKIFVDNIYELKSSENSASGFSIIAKSKKDYRVQINNVLSDIEPILLDGTIIDHASRIRRQKDLSEKLVKQKDELTEKLILAPSKGTLITASKADVKEDIEIVNKLIAKNQDLISQIEYDLKKKLSRVGISLSSKQIRTLTNRVDGDQVIKSLAIFDVMQQISKQLAKLVVENSFSSSATSKYYGIYMVMGEVLAYAQRQYILQIDNTYLPALETIENDIKDAIKFSKKTLKEATNEGNRSILEKNIQANNTTLAAADLYEGLLLDQKKRLEIALEKTDEQIAVAYSTFDTAVNSANLVRLIDDTQLKFSEILGAQLPELISFENRELEEKFFEISDMLLGG